MQAFFVCAIRGIGGKRMENAHSCNIRYITAAPDQIALQATPILDFDLVKRKINKYHWKYISI
jgi:hypothetical protein